MTKITVRRPDGTTEIVERPGTITDMAMRRKMEQATKAAGKGEIIKWEIVQPKLAKWDHCCAHWTREQGCPLHGGD